MLSQPTCVGLRYGHYSPSLAGISRLHGLNSLAVCIATSTRTRLSVNNLRDFPRRSPYQLGRRTSRRGTYPPASCIVKRLNNGTGMSTCCPSASALAYALGPTNPPRITLAAEPSGFRWWRFSLHFSVTHSGIRTRKHSTVASAAASSHLRRSPTNGTKSTIPMLR